MGRSQNCIRHFARLNFSSFISFYCEILSAYLACGEKIIKQASKNSVNLGEKSISDFQSH